MVEYKVVETEHVTAETLERLINLWIGRDYQYEGCHFAMHETSNRPCMAFLRFTRESELSEKRSAEGDVLEIQVGTPLPKVERRLILATLEHVDGDKVKAAKLLGVAARTIYRKLEEYDNSKPR